VTDGTGRRVEKKLKTIDLSSRKIEEERVAVINFAMNERSGDSRSAIHSIVNTPKFANVEKAGFEDTRDVLSKSKIFIKEHTKITSRINRCESDIVCKMNSRREVSDVKKRNSVLEGLSVREFVDIQLETFETAVSRKVML
jgi:hypothetical protein